MEKYTMMENGEVVTVLEVKLSSLDDRFKMIDDIAITMALKSRHHGWGACGVVSIFASSLAGLPVACFSLEDDSNKLEILGITRCERYVFTCYNETRGNYASIEEYVVETIHTVIKSWFDLLFTESEFRMLRDLHPGSRLINHRGDIVVLR